MQPNNQWLSSELHKVVAVAVDNSCKEFGIDNPEHRIAARDIAYLEILKAVWPAGNC